MVFIGVNKKYDDYQETHGPHQRSWWLFPINNTNQNIGLLSGPFLQLPAQLFEVIPLTTLDRTLKTSLQCKITSVLTH